MIAREEGFTLVEMVITALILGVIVGAISTLFARGINADAAQTRRYQDQQYARVAMDKMRREIHAACTVSNPTTYNTSESSITIYFATDNCSSGTHTVSWCAVGSGTRYKLYRIVSASCAGATKRYADYLTTNQVFIYLPPNSHVATLGGGASGISTGDNSSTLPRLHVDLRLNRQPRKTREAFRLVDDIAFRNGPRSCVSGAASC